MQSHRINLSRLHSSTVFHWYVNLPWDMWSDFPADLLGPLSFQVADWRRRVWNHNNLSDSLHEHYLQHHPSIQASCPARIKKVAALWILCMTAPLRQISIAAKESVKSEMERSLYWIKKKSRLFDEAKNVFSLPLVKLRWANGSIWSQQPALCS